MTEEFYMRDVSSRVTASTAQRILNTSNFEGKSIQKVISIVAKARKDTASVTSKRMFFGKTESDCVLKDIEEAILLLFEKKVVKTFRKKRNPKRMGRAEVAYHELSN